MVATPVAAVVVATHGRAERLPRLLAALAAQDLRDPFEVVIVDDGSRDATWTTLERLAEVTPVALVLRRHRTNRGAAAARNTGWRDARAPLIAFTDDDCTPTPGWLSALLRGLEGADVAQGLTVPDPADEHLRGPFARSLTETEEGFYPTANVGYRREALERVDGFDEGFPGAACEDTDLALRVLESGGSSAWVPDAVVHHAVHPSDVRAYFREKRRWSNVPRVIARHPQLRSRMHSRWFWRASHPPALLALVGGIVTTAGAARRSPLGLAAGIVLALPFARFRTRVAPLDAGPRRRVALLPLVLVGDLYEVGVLAAASVRHRSVVL